ncbi:EAL domain-containing protein [Nocardioides iriomotensis]|uniref:EAL domain-containing protein n=1 Tax=Nocardioides iriomotensis TaxID=715784 RepID=A0A4Q5J1I3_9ACTN|nr:EAL domain-containing protein [Nocardioides iriomotensis]
MDQGRVVRLGVGGAAVGAVLLAVAAFGALRAVDALDDRVDAQYSAYARLSGSLDGMGRRPGTEAASATSRAVQKVVDSGIAAGDSEALETRLALWIEDTSDPVAFAALEEQTAAIGEDLSRRQARADLYALGLTGALLALLALGTLLGLRRLSGRQRALARELVHHERAGADARRMSALVETSPDLVAVLDHDSTLSYVSPSASAILGILPEHLVGRRLVDLLSAHDSATVARHLVTARGGDHDVTLRLDAGEGRLQVLTGTLADRSDDPSIEGWVLTVRDVTERHDQEDRANEHTLRDPLTGLANRQLFRDRLEHATDRLAVRQEPLAVLMCDIDDFKHVNESRGHGVGDQVLAEFGTRLQAELSPADTVARMSGDEFAVLLEGRDADGAEKIARRILTRLNEPFRFEDTAVSAHASIGIAVAPDADVTGSDLLRNADVAMAWAKDRGKATFAHYEPGLHALALERLAIRGELQHAIRDNEFVLHFQPTVDLRTETITGFEALVRWQHPTRGLLAPQAFISIAEQSGLIVELGHWVLREACFAAVGLQTALHQPTMSVNVAAQQIVQADFVDWVVAALEDSGLAPRHLVLEITESVLLDDMAGAVERLAVLRDLGVHVAIDDFGTGYSSLAYLSRLPVDILKVDKTFVDNVCDGREGASVTEAIIAMSRTMQLTTVAEGVELPEQAAWLKEAACTMGQGYLWSRPVDLARAHHLMRAGVPRQRVRAEAQPRHAAPWADDSLG